MRCGEDIPSKPKGYIDCRCSNIRIDVDAGRFAAEHDDAIKLFVEEGTELGPPKEDRNYWPNFFSLNLFSLKGYFWGCKRCGDGIAAASSQLRQRRCCNIIIEAAGKSHFMSQKEVAIFDSKIGCDKIS